MMSRGPKSEIEKRNLGDEVVRLRLEGMPQEAIAKTLGVKQDTVSRYLRKVGPLAENPIKTSLKLELTVDLAKMHLGKNLHEAEEQYLKANQEGDHQMAGAWHRQWQNAVDMLLKATGVYERAKKEAEVPAQVETVTWVIKVEG
jgi:predicted transcriptional regulator